MKKFVQCKTPYCDNTFFVNTNKRMKREYLFCRECKKEHSYHALTVQVVHDKPIREIIMDAKMFKTASNMSDYMGVSFVTMYHWLKKYFNVTFQEFRRQYICKSTKCYLLNISVSSYSRHDYVLKKIRDRRYCACINALEKDFIMTNAPLSVISSILRGKPGIEKISDNMFKILPTPIYFDWIQNPIYLIDIDKNLYPIYFSDILD